MLAATQRVYTRGLGSGRGRRRGWPGPKWPALSVSLVWGCLGDLTPRKSPGHRTGPPDPRGWIGVVSGHGCRTQLAFVPPVRPQSLPRLLPSCRPEGGHPGASGGREVGTWHLQPSLAWSVGGLAGLTHRELRAERNGTQLFAEAWGISLCYCKLEQRGGRRGLLTAAFLPADLPGKGCLRPQAGAWRLAKAAMAVPASSLYCRT